MLHIVGNAEILPQSSQNVGEHDELSCLDISSEIQCDSVLAFDAFSISDSLSNYQD
jgi:hypothetical protein